MRISKRYPHYGLFIALLVKGNDTIFSFKFWEFWNLRREIMTFGISRKL